MTLLGILTLVGAGLLVAALAAYLLVVLSLLRKSLFTLGTVNVGVRAIARRVQPLAPVVAGINEDLSRARDGLQGVLDKKGAEV